MDGNNNSAINIDGGLFNIANNVQFLTDIGIINSAPEIKAKLIAGLEESAYNRLVIRLSEILSDEQANELAGLEDEQAVSDWVRKNVPDLLFMVGDILEELKQELLAQKAQVTAPAVANGGYGETAAQV
jgi:hypothetical protein